MAKLLEYMVSSGPRLFGALLLDHAQREAHSSEVASDELQLFVNASREEHVTRSLCTSVLTLALKIDEGCELLRGVNI